MCEAATDDMLHRTISTAIPAPMEATHAMSQHQLPDPAPNLAGDDTGKVLSLPIGMASPLWAAFAGAAAAGAAFWWMTRWTRATNLEALIGLPADVAETIEIAVAEAEDVVETAQAAVAEAVIEAAPVIAPMDDAILPGPLPESALEPVLEAAPEAEPEPTPEPVPVLPDDLTRIVGIGPKLSAALAERGLTTFTQLAALEGGALEELDKALDLKGRAVRDAWVAQAARFAQVH